MRRPDSVSTPNGWPRLAIYTHRQHINQRINIPIPRADAPDRPADEQARRVAYQRQPRLRITATRDDGLRETRPPRQASPPQTRRKVLVNFHPQLRHR